MKKTVKIAALILVVLALVIAAVLFFQGVNVAVLNPQGEIADKQRNLIVFTLLLSAVVVIPVFVMLALFAWKFREGNENAVYEPNWDNNNLLETIWWGIPCAIILILGIVTWQTSHELDPFKSLDSNAKPIKVQVVALQWRWLFIYPEQRIASVNLVQFPEKTPINFTLTADAPMNSFWVPSLGSQVYAMSGMSTKLHLIANRTGDFKGSSANISGRGFANMAFTARSSTQAEFDAWVRQNSMSPGLDWSVYENLAQPSMDDANRFYALKDDGLYDKVVMKYMAPAKKQEKPDEPHEYEGHSDMMHMPGMEGM